MTVLSRRSVVLGALACGVLGRVPAYAAGLLSLPVGAMALSRRIERGLSDGASIVVQRTWQIQFSQQGSGAAITGHQTGAKVTAPTALAPLAQIEEARSTDAMFPILLLSSGKLAAAGDYVLEQDLAQAAREAERVIASRKAGADAKAEQLQYLAFLQRRAGKLIERLPDDLFYPANPIVEVAKPIDLGDGQVGEFELTYEAKCAPGEAWLAQSERRIITRLGDTRQLSREVWTMAPARAMYGGGIILPPSKPADMLDFEGI